MWITAWVVGAAVAVELNDGDVVVVLAVAC